MPTKQQLTELCKQLGIKGYSKMNKAQLESIIFLKRVADVYETLFQPVLQSEALEKYDL